MFVKSLNGTVMVGNTLVTKFGRAGGHTWRIHPGYKFGYQDGSSPSKSGIGNGARLVAVDITANGLTN